MLLDDVVNSLDRDYMSDAKSSLPLPVGSRL
jgi:hypothetical protein